jgi:hypothetical protein
MSDFPCIKCELWHSRCTRQRSPSSLNHHCSTSILQYVYIHSSAMSSQGATSSSGATSSGTHELVPHALHYTIVTRSCTTWNKQEGRYEHPSRIYLLSPSTSDAPSMDGATAAGILEMVEKGVHLVSRMRQTALASCFRDQDTEAEGWGGQHAQGLRQ